MNYDIANYFARDACENTAANNRWSEDTKQCTCGSSSSSSEAGTGGRSPYCLTSYDYSSSKSKTTYPSRGFVFLEYILVVVSFGIMIMVIRYASTKFSRRNYRHSDKKGIYETLRTNDFHDENDNDGDKDNTSGVEMRIM